MIDISKGKYWDFGWQLIDGCAPCSPGCDNCWSLAMEKRFRKGDTSIKTHPERLDRPSKRKKPAVYAIWNDLFHEDVPIDFIGWVYFEMNLNYQHTYLILTKRADRMAEITNLGPCRLERAKIWRGLTVCNQQEADEKIPIFMKVPGKKFLSIEPMLGGIDLTNYFWSTPDGKIQNQNRMGMPEHKLSAIILGGETSPKARPMHPDWVRSVKNQCQAAGVPFFFKSWGEHAPFATTAIYNDGEVFGGDCGGPSCLSGLSGDRRKDAGFVIARWDDGRKKRCRKIHMSDHRWGRNNLCKMTYVKCGKPLSGRILDGRTHDDLAWVKE